MKIIHHMTAEQIRDVEEATAKMTDVGWVVPGFIMYLWAGLDCQPYHDLAGLCYI